MAIPTLPPPSAKAVEIGERVKAFLDEHIIPAEPIYHRQLDEGDDRWHAPPIMDELKAKAKKAGLWNLFLPKKHFPGFAHQSRIRAASARSWAARRSAASRSTARRPTPATWRR